MKTITRNWVTRFAFAALLVAPFAAGSASAQNRSYGSYGGGSGASGGGGHYQTGRSFSGGGYSGGAGYRYGGANGAGRASGANAGRSYSSGGYHAGSSGRSYGSGAGHSGSTPSHSYYSASASTNAAKFGGGSQAHLTMKPEVAPHIGSQTSRVGGFNSFSTQKMPEVQHSTHLKQSHYTGMGSGSGKKNSKAPIQGVKLSPSASSTKTYDKPINLAGRSVSHVPGTGSSNSKNY
jgi:hypothetical protein